MKKEELIDKYERKYETIYGFPVIQLNQILEDLKQLDGPQKVIVPQFVANWYEKNKYNLEFNMWDYVYLFDRQEDTSFKKWFNDPKAEPFKTLVNMHQFGYEVKEEKRYLVRLKGIAERYCYLNYSFLSEGWFFDDEHTNTNTRAKHTRKELENAGFGWVFNCPGVEIEEVE